MKDGSSTDNPPDNRLWAILFIAVYILMIAFLRHVDSETVARESRPQMMLHVNGGELTWLPEDEAVHDGKPTEVPAEFTPFFFARVPVNSAGMDVLQTLPGIGPGMAERITEFRTTHGPIRNSETFMRIPGIGSKRYESLQPYISFE